MTDPIVRLNAALEGLYRIDREIGEGGMALVYAAEDLRHGRTVAMKVLKPELAAAIGADRFLREIRTTANLQHPHILPLFDSGEADGFLYYVMPFVEGETLRERLDREGELPVAQAVRILRDVADGLAYAHDHGIVHRDIKPGNIMLAGRHAMVTDFGVAKALGDAAQQGHETATGMALGTPTYMAPEQAAADPQVDHRADLYALGVVAYELLTGLLPFRGKSTREILLAHVAGTPDPIGTHRDTVPGPLDAAVMKCLAKHPADRWQSAEELLEMLEAAATPPSGITPVGTPPARVDGPASRLRQVGAAAAIAVVLVLAGAGWWMATTGESAPEALLTVVETRRLTTDPGLEVYPALSPDGRSVVYAAGGSLRMRLYLRPVGGGRTIPLTEDSTSVEQQPRWSPDGDRILFLSDGDARVVSHLGGRATVVARGRDRSGAEVTAAAWSPDGTEVAIVRDDTLAVITLEDGSERVVGGAPALRHCAWAPDGLRLACVQGNESYGRPGVAFGNLAPSAIVTVELETGAVEPVVPADATNQSPAWILGGRGLLFVSDRDGSQDIFVQRFAADGGPEGDAMRLTTGSGAHSVSATPDGSRIAYSVYTAESNIWTLPVPERPPVGIEGARQLTLGAQVVESIRLSRDGRWVLYDSDIAGDPDIWRIPREGGTPERLTSSPRNEFSPDLSPDGAELAYHAFVDGSRDVLVRSLETGAVERLTSDPEAEESYPRWSPDGRTLAYQNQADNSIRLRRRQPGGAWGPEETLVAELADRVDWAADGRRLALPYDDGLALADAETGAVRQLVPDGPGNMGEVFWGTADRTLHFKRIDESGTATIWEVPAPGGEPRLMVRLDGARGQSPRTDLAGDGRDYFFALVERQSDVWIAETGGSGGTP